MIVRRFLITFPDGSWKDSDSLQEAIGIIGDADATIEDTNDGIVYTRKDFPEIQSYILLG